MQRALCITLSLYLSCVAVLNAQDADACLSNVLANATHPECETNEDLTICFGGIDVQRREDVRALMLCEWPGDWLDVQSALEGFSSLRKLVISSSNLTELAPAFPPETARFLETVVITWTRLRQLPPESFADLPNLRRLDLRNNELATIRPELLRLAALSEVYLAGNPLVCTENVTWMLGSEEESFSRKLADKDELLCAPPFEARPLIPVLEIIWTLKRECQKTKCECKLVYVLGRANKQVPRQLMAFVEVNCSYRGLTEMPGFLPENTTALRLTGNKIKDLTPLTMNPAYKGVIDLYLDDNVVDSIVELEGSRWLDHFRLLNLRGNRLTDLPTYAFENVLLRSENAASLYLGRNPWRCDCLFTPGFQDLLIRYGNLMKDINDVQCAPIPGDDNSYKQLRDLTRMEICMSAEDELLLHPLDILSIVLASLIVLILGKLLYDYWSFKKTGKLPWIVAKIP